MKHKIQFELEFKKNTYPGKLIAFEGMDASGKTTQAKRLANYLTEKGEKVFLTKNPTREGEIGVLIHKILQKQVKVPSVAIQYLYSADREVQQIEIVERLKKGETVITDRYFWSAVPYGLADLKDASVEDAAKIILVAQSILSHYHGFIIPDYTFYLEVSVNEAVKRLSEMHKIKEIYEEKELFERVKQGYDFLIGEFKDEIIVINGERDEEEVTEEIAKILNNTD
ncbi:MAG: dTMP kinase [Candidatus Levybacteria bacterium RBG_16_35_11]|nr:MAG: dTMP kinase [Candidatus Levybacteria bacterium RBG_16_35_11]